MKQHINNKRITYVYDKNWPNYENLIKSFLDLSLKKITHWKKSKAVFSYGIECVWITYEPIYS